VAVEDSVRKAVLLGEHVPEGPHITLDPFPGQQAPAIVEVTGDHAHLRHAIKWIAITKESRHLARPLAFVAKAHRGRCELLIDHEVDACHHQADPPRSRAGKAMCVLLDARFNPRRRVFDQIAGVDEATAADEPHRSPVQQNRRCSHYGLAALRPHDGLGAGAHGDVEAEPRRVLQELGHTLRAAPHDLLQEHGVGSKGHDLWHAAREVDHLRIDQIAWQSLFEVGAQDE
jgi:hypothetical protein